MTFELRGGPQDGGRVRGVALPEELFVGRSPKGNGLVAWARARSPRFPCRYVYSRRANKYLFKECRA